MALIQGINSHYQTLHRVLEVFQNTLHHIYLGNSTQDTRPGERITPLSPTQLLNIKSRIKEMDNRMNLTYFYTDTHINNI